MRDFHQAKIANDQNEVMKRLTVIASLLLVPTFIVGLYGQNFRNIPELALGLRLRWLGLIVVTTAPSCLLPLEGLDRGQLGEAAPAARARPALAAGRRR